MAQWVNRARTDGGQSIQITWRIQGRWQCETFTDPRTAAEFRAAVEACGQQRPPGWIKGSGWTPPEPQPEPEPVTVEQVASGPGGYFAEHDKRMRRGKVKPYTVHRAHRTYALHLAPLFGPVTFTDLDPEWPRAAGGTLLPGHRQTSLDQSPIPARRGHDARRCDQTVRSAPTRR